MSATRTSIDRITPYRNAHSANSFAPKGTFPSRAPEPPIIIAKSWPCFYRGEPRPGKSGPRVRRLTAALFMGKLLAASRDQAHFLLDSLAPCQALYGSDRP